MTEQNMLESKVIIESLPIGGPDEAERRIHSDKGEMAQIVNRENESFRQIVYWDIDSPRTGVDRGHHYHRKKTDRMYVISGEVELLLEDPHNGEKLTARLKAGDRVFIAPGVAHAVRSLTRAQVLEYAPDPYDPADTYPYRLTGG
jgi:dTDP-4-dehydrorhamnose 3,5-epimerase-like enzyme